MPSSVPVCALHLLWLSVGYVATEVMWCVVVFGFGMVSSANLVGYYPISLVLWGMDDPALLPGLLDGLPGWKIGRAHV